MKRFLPVTSFIIVLVVIAGLFAQVAPATAVQTSSAVQVPDALKLAVTALLTMAFALGTQALFQAFGLDLRGVGSAVAIAVSGFIIAQVQGYINVIPMQYDATVMVVLNVLTVIFAGAGAIRALIHPQHAANMFLP